MDQTIAEAKERFGMLIEEQLKRVEGIKEQEGFINYDELDRIIVGIIGGDGIGPAITGQAQRILEFLLREEIEKGRVRFRVIEGLTIQDRVRVMKAIPDDVLGELRRCHVILKGPTTTPRQGDPWPNVESANVAMRRELDLFANVRPVKVPENGIDWTFFRENTEGAYILGSKGFHVNDDIAFDFKVITSPGAERIARSALEYAKGNGKKRMTIVTKANVVKTTDGKFLTICKEVGREYPEIEIDDWYIDIIAAKLLDEKKRTEFEVFILPNLYGDILTDEAAQLQGGVGTAGSANIGKRYAMFEAIHGSAPRMVQEGRALYADPSSIIRATSMLLTHIGYREKAEKLDKALEICTRTERKLIITGRHTGATGQQFADYIMETIQS